MATQTDPAGLQPDFNRMAECHQILSTELQHCQNLPAIAGAQEILAAIAQLREQMNRMERNLTSRMSANDHNSIARTQNSLLTSRDENLSPLHNPTTNAAIPDFPSTPREIDQLPAQAANATLGALGQGTDGSLPVKRQRIRITVGLPAVRKEGP
ncbi:hypothetical protein BDY17DRAFT_328513 [Neohortaea acidophila]|uniref:Uncharacterized protein n=1 Tax=Neohortaea acidophila TaxID=245834 RepID=A0A6A6PEP9_9PEZI|nr:uncharacterized protein BDY17DRAFT_328513 [Neohortaea acidophila]KAF2478448.1 hypothetical protein BDY17DRAFT_328513 [Neohortaea acidophila]